jgi:RNA polymerase sigma-70 factor (ECF subfamily)
MSDKTVNILSKDKEKLFKSLFDNYFNILLLNAKKYIGNIAESEEIVQDVFVKLWEHLDRLPQNTNFKAYLYMAVHNSCQNYIKHKLIVDKHNSTVLAESMNSTNSTSNDNKELLNLLYKTINQLPEKWRTTFVMNRFDGFKYREIAIKQNISVKTVEKYISKSLRFLQKNLKDYKLLLLLIISQYL